MEPRKGGSGAHAGGARAPRKRAPRKRALRKRALRKRALRAGALRAGALRAGAPQTRGVLEVRRFFSIIALSPSRSVVLSGIPQMDHWDS